MSPQARSNISGNMLIYILGAIFLMGLLIVLLKGSFQEGTGIDAEKVVMQAGELQRYGSEVERGVGYILRDGYSESDLRFANPNTASYGLITDTPEQQVFSADGGAVEWRNPPTGSQVAAAEWIFSGANALTQIGSTCATASCSDLLIVLPDITEALCTQINRGHNITTTTGDPPAADSPLDLTTYFTSGVFSYSQTLTSTEDALDAQAEGCFSSAGEYYYYRVLLPR
jgi:hypothetical protein